MLRIRRALAPFGLALALVAPAVQAGEIQQITIGVSLVGSLDSSPNDYSGYSFYARANQRIRIRVGGHAAFVPRAEIKGLPGVIWSGTPPGGTTVTSPWVRIPQDGPYAINIFAAQSAQAGSYTVHTTSDAFQMSEQPRGQYQLGTEQRGWLASALHQHGYIFNVPYAGYRATISGRGGEGLGPRLLIRDPGGNTVYDASASSNGSFGPNDIIFMRPGNYGASVMAAGGDSGVYAFTIAPQGAAPGAPQPPSVNAGQQIIIDFPTPGTAMTPQFLFRGRTTRYPFEGKLHWKVLDENGSELANDFFPVNGAVGGPASWEVVVGRPWVGTGRRLIVQVYDFDGAVTGQITALASVALVADDG
jgi:hypothetical protein